MIRPAVLILEQGQPIDAQQRCYNDQDITQSYFPPDPLSANLDALFHLVRIGEYKLTGS